MFVEAIVARAPRILFVCLRNSCRSPMAEGFMRDLLPNAEIRSAGLFPLGRVDPLAIHVMRLLGIDISKQRSRPLRPSDVAWADLVVLLSGDDETIGTVPSWEKWVRWNIEDPLGWPADVYEDVRDEIRARIEVIRAWVKTRLHEDRVEAIQGNA